MIFLLLLLQAPSDTGTVPATQRSKIHIVNKLTDASLPSSVLGEGWRHFQGFAVDDLNETKRIAPELLKVKGFPEKLKSLGVIGATDYSLARTKAPFDSVTVQVFVFADVAKCNAWWKKKYKFDGWEKTFRAVSDDRFDEALDSISKEYPSANSRNIRLGKVSITSFHLGKSDEHLKAAEYIIQKLATPKDKAKLKRD